MSCQSTPVITMSLVFSLSIPRHSTQQCGTSPSKGDILVITSQHCSHSYLRMQNNATIRLIAPPTSASMAVRAAHNHTTHTKHVLFKNRTYTCTQQPRCSCRGAQQHSSPLWIMASWLVNTLCGSRCCVSSIHTRDGVTEASQQPAS